MIIDVKPIAHVDAISVDRERLSFDRVQNSQGDQLFRELIGSIVIGTVRYDDRQFERFEPGVREMVGRGFAGRIR